VYDGTTATTSRSRTTGVAGDVLTTAYTSATFADKNVGTAKAVSVSGITVTGDRFGQLHGQHHGRATANITARAITVTAVTDTKVYDGTTSSAQTPRLPSAAGRRRTRQLHQAFSTAPWPRADARAERLGHRRNSGNNYGSPWPTPTGVISAKALSVSGVTANSKVYDAPRRRH